MAFLSALWLPIVLSAVVVFIASSIIHMVLTYHRSDFQKLPNEAKILDALRAESIAPGMYLFPHAATTKAMGTPEMQEKFKRGPVGLLMTRASGAPTMGKNLVQWFLYCLVVGVFVAYLTNHTLGPDASYLAVFRVAGTVAFLAYAGSMAQDAIWMGQPWSTTLKSMFDGLVYGLLTAGVFGWLWM